MGYTLAADRDRVVLRHFGDASQEEVEAARRDAAACVVGLPVDRVLVDARAVTPPFSLDGLVRSGPCHFELLPAHVSVAVVYDPDTTTAASARRVQDRFSKGPTVRVFGGLDEANAWLELPTEDAGPLKKN